jgi:RimJ/RimL family protein N-acetyltransferase
MQPVASVVLVPFSREHLGAFAAIMADPDVLRFTRFPNPPQPAFPEEWLARYEHGRRDGTKEAFAVVSATDPAAFLGLALGVDIDRATATAELGYLVAPDARGRGIATAAVALLTRWAFEEEGLRRLVLLIDRANAASLKVAARCGYVYDGPHDESLLSYSANSLASGAPQPARSDGGGTL